MAFWPLVVAGVLAFAGVLLLVDGHRHARRCSLPERLRDYQPSSLADEAKDWLDQH